MLPHIWKERNLVVLIRLGNRKIGRSVSHDANGLYSALDRRKNSPTFVSAREAIISREGRALIARVSANGFNLIDG